MSEIVRATEEHLTACRHYYHGSGERFFPLLCRMIDKLRDKHLHAKEVRSGPSTQLGRPSRARRPVVTKLHRGAGYTERFVDDGNEVDVSRPGAEQPFLMREPRGPKTDYVDSLEDDVEDTA